MVDQAEVRGDAATLNAHLASTRFLAGVEEGRWSVLLYRFPELVVEIHGVDVADSVSTSMIFQLMCDQFPAQPPFVQRWDPRIQARPPSPTAEQSPPGVVDAFKEWSEGPITYGGVYRAWQRHAATHNNWAALRPDEAWRRDRHLTFILEKLYGLVCEQAAWLAVRSAA